MVEPKYCLVQFKLTYKTVPGEDIRVVGSIQELGNWNYNKAEKLVTSKLEFPLWKTKENIKIKQDSEVFYKYLIFKNGVFDRWETLPNNVNRSLNPKNMLRMIVHDTQEVNQSKIEKFTKLNSYESIGMGTPKNNQKVDYEDNENKFDFREMKIKKLFLGLNSESGVQRQNLISTIKENLITTPRSNTMKEDFEYADLNYEPEEEDYLPQTKSQVEEKELTDSDKVIMCSLYLPYRAVKNEKTEEWELELTNDPFYHTLSKLCQNKEKIIWIGLLKGYHQIKNENERDAIVSKLQKKHNMFVVKLDEISTKRMHTLISAILEPLFHYITMSHAIKQIKEFEEMWKAYKTYNELLAKIVIHQFEKNSNSLVFLHDYHLFLAPSYIYNIHQHSNGKTSVVKNVSIGLFLHSPFPSHDVFRRFPYREEILKSMMNCSMIGFHTFDSSRNFLTSCRRLLLINSMSILKGDLALSYFGRKVIIRVKHVSSTPDLIMHEINDDLFKKTFSEIRNKFKDKYIFVAVDNLGFLAGIRHKLEAYKRFLRDIGDNYKQNVLVQYIDISEDNSFYMEDEKELIEEMRLSIIDLAVNIKKEFGDDILEIVQKKITYTERLAILAAGKCYVKSSKKEAFSLDVYEFLNLKILMNDTSEMGYILSELSGVSTSLSGAIKVNPFDIHSIQRGFEEAFQVHFDREEHLSFSQEKDIIHIKKNNFELWMNSFLKELKNLLDNDEDTYYLGAGIGLNFRLMKISSNFKELDRPKLVNDYEKAKRRLILLDYEGTLPSSNNQIVSECQSKGLLPNAKVLNTLDYLTKDKRNTIFIITGREAKLVSEWFSSVPDLGLASEHGFLYRYHTNAKAKEKWEKMLNGFNGDWRSFCVEQLEPYTERCEGSFIEVKESSVVWQYRDCDPELGKSFAQVITADFENSLKNLKLKVINGKGYVEVKPEGINKGAFASFILKQEIKRKRAPDFILAIGDDTADEEMFTYLKKKSNEIKNYTKNCKIYTIVVGKKPSSADCYVDTTSDVRTILEAFMQVSARKSKSNSVYDIRALAININESSTTLSNENKNQQIVDEIMSINEEEEFNNN